MGKIFFLADAHLGARIIGNPRWHEQKLVALLEHMKQQGATAIYMLGDMFDFWYEYKAVIPKGHTRFLGKLAELADSGIELHFFIGNHDMWTFGYLQDEIGMTVHYHPETIVLNGKTCFLAHGDGLHTDEKSFMLLRKVFHNRFCQKLFGMIPSSWGMGFGLRWSLSNRRKEQRHTNEYQGEDNEPLVRFAKYSEQHTHIDYYLFGHRHILLDLLLSGGSRIVILGDCMEQFTYACLDADGQLTLFAGE